MNNFIKFLYSFLAVVVTALIASYFVDVGMQLFYPQLQLPPMTPPDNIFPIVWSLLYVLMIFSYYMILKSNETMRVQSASLLFLGQLFLQMVWAFMFFYSAYFLYGLIVILLLLWTVWVMIRKFKIINPAAAYLQYPYFVWLLYATYLNIGVVYLNGNGLKF